MPVTPLHPPAMNPNDDTDDALAGLIHRSRRLEDAPEAAIQRALGLFQRAPVSAKAAAAGWRELVARLVSDTFDMSPQALGLRGGKAETRQLLFAVEGRDIDVRLSRGDGGWELWGQILGPDEAGEAELHCGDWQASTPWTPLAEFRFRDVPTGECRLTLRTGAWISTLPAFRIPA